MRSRIVPTILLLLLTGGLGLSLINPLYPHEQTLQHMPTVAALGVLAWIVHRRLLSTGSLACLSAMLALHIVGARYIYTFTPYDEWFRAALGSGPADWFGWKRNHFDRFVHLAFGALVVLPGREIAIRAGRMGPGWSTLFAVFAVMSVSAAYEIAEWLLTIVMSPHDSEAYNGQQGDFWDAQQDMALATIGALAVGIAATGLKRRGGSRLLDGGAPQSAE